MSHFSNPNLNFNLDFNHETYPVAVRHNCRSVWCKDCYRKNVAPRQSARMSEMDWKRTRMITLTLNPDNWADGEDAYMWFRLHKPIGRFIQALNKAGVKVTDWTCNLEWHDNGYPHWHLLIQVEKSGYAGMIGQSLLHELWSFGDVSHRIHESYFKSKDHFKKFTGYFCKTGYLHKDKAHQVELPGWASGRGWAGLRINRFSSMRRRLGLPAPDKNDNPEKRFIRKLTYLMKHNRCGQLTELWEIEIIHRPDSFSEPPEIIRTKIGTYNVPYDLVINNFEGEFYEKAGYSIEASTELVRHVLSAWQSCPPSMPTKKKEYQEALPLGMIDFIRKHDIAKAVAIREQNNRSELSFSLYGVK